jgi:hypothetical protein
MSKQLPVGWEERRNNLSEHDMMLVRVPPFTHPSHDARAPVDYTPTKANAHRTTWPTTSTSDPRSPLPPRSHQNSQGAAAGGTFSSKGIIANAYADGTEHHKTSEQVEEHWMSMIEKEKEEAGASRTPGSLPWGFEQRAKVRDAEAKAYGAAEAALRAKANMSSMPSDAGEMNQMNPSSSLPPPAFASADRHAPPPTAAIDANGGADEMPVSAEVALVRVTVHAMEQLASALKAKPVPLEPQERAAFAAAMKRCMDAVMHCR